MSTTVTTGVPSCSTLDCIACLQCSFEFDCTMEYDACQDDMGGCVSTLDCLEECLKGTPDTLATCATQCECGMLPNLASDLSDCAATVCDDPCVQAVPCSTLD